MIWSPDKLKVKQTLILIGELQKKEVTFFSGKEWIKNLKLLCLFASIMISLDLRIVGWWPRCSVIFVILPGYKLIGALM